MRKPNADDRPKGAVAKTPQRIVFPRPYEHPPLKVTVKIVLTTEEAKTLFPRTYGVIA